MLVIKTGKHWCEEQGVPQLSAELMGCMVGLWATVNGPVNIVFCGGPPLPGLLFTKTNGVTNMACSMYEHTLGGWHTR